MKAATLIGIGSLTTALALQLGCGGGEPADSAPEAPAAKAPAPAEDDAPAAEDRGPDTPLPTVIAVQAQFATEGGKPMPKPAKLVLLRKQGDTWYRESFEDPDSNVFHKAVAWRDGILTIGAQIAPAPATLKYWTRGDDGWTAETLWSAAWEGARFNRLRDLEIGDVDGDGADELVIATHDRGVVAVGDEGDEGWTFTEFDETADTFVHEIEIGDVDGDGALEFYATPSARNRASGESQPGSVVRYDYRDGAYVRSTVVDYDESHAKEITVTDTNGDGVDELYVVREAHKVKEGGKAKRVDPVRIEQFTKGAEGWSGEVVATLDDDQCRFLVPGDVDGDDDIELVAAGYKSGLWVLQPDGDGTWTPELVDRDSGGFEHASHVADLDGDGANEIYVAADTQKQFRVYVHDGEGYERTVIGAIGPSERSHITWNLQDGTF